MTTHPVRPTPRRAIASRAPIAAALLAALALIASACTRTEGDDPPPAPATEPSAPLDGMATDAAADEARSEPTDDASADESSAPGADDPGASDDALAASLADLAGAADATLVEDWSALGSSDGVEATVTRNLGMGENAMMLSLFSAQSAAPLPGAAVEMSFTISEDDPHDFVGFDRTLDAPADWSEAHSAALWLDGSAAPGANLVFQFREASGEVWRYAGPMPKAGASEPLLLALDADTFAWAPWSREESGTIDLEAIDQYGVYVGHAGAGLGGVVMLGPIAVLSD